MEESKKPRDQEDIARADNEPCSLDKALYLLLGQRLEAGKGGFEVASNTVAQKEQKNTSLAKRNKKHKKSTGVLLQAKYSRMERTGKVGQWLGSQEKH